MFRLNYKKLPSHIQQTIIQIALRVKKLEASIKKDIGKDHVSSTDSDDYKSPVVDYIDKAEIK